MPDLDVMTIVADALERTDPATRAAHLDRACSGDPDLRGRVEVLLAAHIACPHEPDAISTLDAPPPEETDATATFTPDAPRPANMASGENRPDDPAGTFVPSDLQAAAELLPLVYDELRKLAFTRLAIESPDHSLNPTALVHEAYLRLVGDQEFQGRGHFFAAAAEAMRRVLVDHARNRNRLKRGGKRRRVELDRLTDLAAATDDDLLELNDALDRLAQEFPAAAELVKLRFFAGMTLTEAARVLGLSDRSADRYWVFARTWLADALARE